MRVLLINPSITLHKMDVSPPSKSALIGLGYVASALRSDNHNVNILDCMISSNYHYSIDSDFSRYGLSDKEIFDRISEVRPDVVGVSCMFTSYFMDAHNVARIAKEYDPNILVVFGGSHATQFPDRVLRDKNVDVTVIGEGEVTIREILKRFEINEGFGGVKGTIYRVDGRVVEEPRRQFIRNLDNIPFPAWDLLEKDMEVIAKEHKANKFLMRKPLGYILTSRGCPNNCYFCSVKLSWGRRWRYRSAANVVDEIEYLKNKYGYREFHFVDDNSSVSRKRMHEICDEILMRKMDIKIATPTGIAIQTLDREILEKMKKAGFYRLCFGIESGDPESQKIIKKYIRLDKAKKIIAVANDLGFWTAATFIIGHPHETMKEIRATIDFAKESNLDFAIFYLLVPQPGTVAYEILKGQGMIDLDKYLDPGSDDWYKISITYSNGIKTRYFSNSELQDMLSKVYREFIIHKMFSYRTYLNICKKARSMEDVIYLIRLSSVAVRMVLKLGKKLSNLSIYSNTNKKTLSKIEM